MQSIHEILEQSNLGFLLEQPTKISPVFSTAGEILAWNFQLQPTTASAITVAGKTPALYREAANQ